MLKFDAEQFFWISSLIEITRNIVRTTTVDKKLEEEDRQLFKTNLEGVDKYCAALELPLSVKQVSRCLDDFNDADCTYEKVRHLLNELQNRIGDELSDRTFLRITTEKAKFYDKAKDQFGKAIIEKFPSIEFDVEEAGKCFATGRDTGCVFHVMRIMEAGLKIVVLMFFRIDRGIPC